MVYVLYIRAISRTLITSLNISTGIGQCPSKNRVMSDESCFTTDTVIRREVKKKFIRYGRLETQNHSVSIGLSCSGFSFYEYFNRQFTNAVFLYSKPYDVFK